MKKKKITKKLLFSKTTVTMLNSNSMKEIIGGTGYDVMGTYDDHGNIVDGCTPDANNIPVLQTLQPFPPRN